MFCSSHTECGDRWSFTWFPLSSEIHATYPSLPHFCYDTDHILGPIRSCTGRGLPAHSVSSMTGGLLHHRFTLIHLRFATMDKYLLNIINLSVVVKRRQTVYFLLHFPYPHGSHALRGALSCGARTFLPDTLCRGNHPTDSSNYQ